MGVAARWKDQGKVHDDRTVVVRWSYGDRTVIDWRPANLNGSLQQTPKAGMGRDRRIKQWR